VPSKVQKTAAFNAWLDGLTDTIAQDAISDRLARIETGLLGDHKSVGDRVSEFRVDVGQGYRLYYTLRGRVIVLLLCGGGKKTQRADIRRAEAMVKAMKKRKAEPSAGGVRERRSTYTAETGEDEEFSFTEEELAVSPLDVADYLGRESSQIYVLRNALESGHPGYIAVALGAVARARGLSKLERETGIKRQTLNKSLSRKGNPTLETLTTVLGALGLRLEVVEDRANGPTR